LVFALADRGGEHCGRVVQQWMSRWPLKNQQTNASMKPKINFEDFRVPPGKKVNLKTRPTLVKPICKSKKHHKKLLEEQVEELSSLQPLHYASNRHALLLIFQAVDLNFRTA
jgi:hypothetical protein